jgi:hypothetical protein
MSSATILELITDCRAQEAAFPARYVRCLAVHASWSARLVSRRVGLEVGRPCLAWGRANHVLGIALLVLGPTLLVLRTTMIARRTALHAFRRTRLAFRIALLSTEVATSAF